MAAQHTMAFALCCINLTNGIPDTSSLITYQRSLAVTVKVAWTSTRLTNLYNSCGSDLLRGYSLGFSSTTVSGNDTTGTNGTFSSPGPPVQAPRDCLQNASQNYINNTPPVFPSRAYSRSA